MDVPPIINQPILENHHFREFLDMPHARCARSSLIVSDIVIFVNGFAVAFFGANFKKDNSCTGLRKLGFHSSTCFCMEVARIQPKDLFQTGDSLRVHASQFGHSRGASWQLRQLTGQMYPALSSDQTDTLVETPPVSMRLLMAPEYEWVEKNPKIKWMMFVDTHMD